MFCDQIVAYQQILPGFATIFRGVVACMFTPGNSRLFLEDDLLFSMSFRILGSNM